jgi:hypothetical protein
MAHYNCTSPMILQTEFTGPGYGTIRCHPGYREGDAWYDWVEVAEHEGRVDPIPFQVVAVVPIRDDGSSVTRYELIGLPCTTRTECDSVLFTEWDVSVAYSVIRVDVILRRCFAVKVSPKVVAVVRPSNEWPYHFTH